MSRGGGIFILHFNMATFFDKTRHIRVGGIICALLFLFPFFSKSILAAIPSNGTAFFAPQAVGGPLKVSANGRYLVYSDGRPFFYLGDTAWELFHRLDRGEADAYLQDRAGKGFNVIQATVLAEQDGLRVPNPYGHVPFHNLDPAKPNEYYFQHVDYIVNKAESLGMYTALLPTWGDKWNNWWGIGPMIFNPTNARTYGAWLANRYKYKPIIWILGGDRVPSTSTHYQVIRAMAEGIRSVVGNSQLITFHPEGKKSSASFFHGDTWLNFNSYQSGHYAYDLSFAYTLASENYRRSPAKPSFNIEPLYEDHPVNWNPGIGWFNDYDVRQAAYWSVFSGSAGHVYGNHNIWQFYDPYGGYSRIGNARTPWRQALGHAGAGQMMHLRRLMEARKMLTLVPDQGLVASGQGSGADYIASARGEDFAFIYLSTGQNITINLGKVTGSEVRGWWYDPRTGKAIHIGKFGNSGTKAFDAPGTKGRGNDWILILDDASKNYAAPDGTTPTAPTPAAPIANCSATGTILREIWSNASGIAITSIPLSQSPTSTQQLTQFETTANFGDNYGTRVRGYICPPTTGNYTFWIAGDDNTELWLSTSDNPANKVKIAYSNWTSWREWTKYASQKSAAIGLEAGKKYYIEALHKEAYGGGDGVTVGWQLPSGLLERPIPGSRLSPYASSTARIASQPEGQQQEEKTIRVYPNPANDKVTFTFTTQQTGTVEVVIQNALAREVKRTRVQAQPGSTTVVIPVDDLSPGFYFINQGSHNAQKLIIER